MKKLRTQFNRFCYKHREKGIPNLMLYVSLGAALVYLMSTFAKNDVLYDWLYFDRSLILQGQIWRLITYPLTYSSGSLLLTAVSLLCYYSLGRAIENVWGTLRFNLFYLSGVVLMDIYCMIFGGFADAYYLNLSLFLAYATMYPNSGFLLFFIIPVKAWIFALMDLVLVLVGLITYPFPYNFFSVISIANYFLFFGKDVLNLIPIAGRANTRRLFRKKGKTTQSGTATESQPRPKVIPFPTAGSYQASTATVKAPYTHKCTVCGRTDVSDPDLEFRYCSRCNGYHCYCQDHISNHNHIQ